MYDLTPENKFELIFDELQDAHGLKAIQVLSFFIFRVKRKPSRKLKKSRKAMQKMKMITSAISLISIGHLVKPHYYWMSSKLLVFQ